MHIHMHMHIHLQSLSGSGKLTTVSSKHHSSGKTISIPSSFPQVHTMTSRLEPLYPQRWHSHPSLPSRYVQDITNHTPAWQFSTATTIMALVLARKPSSPQSSSNSTYRMITKSQLPWFQISNLILPTVGGEKEPEKESVKHYQVLVGSLMYAALAMRPDISYTVAALC